MIILQFIIVWKALCANIEENVTYKNLEELISHCKSAKNSYFLSSQSL